MFLENILEDLLTNYLVSFFTLACKKFALIYIKKNDSPTVHMGCKRVLLWNHLESNKDLWIFSPTSAPFTP